MAAQGCFGVCVSNRRHLIWSDDDSHPDALGHWLVHQIRDADLLIWKEQAKRLRPTASDSTLTADERYDVLKWLTHHKMKLKENRWDMVTLTRACWEHFSGQQFADVLEPCLRTEPRRFWRMLWGNLGMLLSLGLYPAAKSDHICDPSCEWVHILDFDDEKFHVGKTVPAEDHHGTIPGVKIWTPKSPGFHFFASFPATSIPRNWLEIAHDNWEQEFEAT